MSIIARVRMSIRSSSPVASRQRSNRPMASGRYSKARMSLRRHSLLACQRSAGVLTSASAIRRTPTSSRSLFLVAIRPRKILTRTSFPSISARATILLPGSNLNIRLHINGAVLPDLSIFMQNGASTALPRLISLLGSTVSIPVNSRPLSISICNFLASRVFRLRGFRLLP